MDNILPSSETGDGKCLICYQKSHGNHFGVESCRACAAFFRRVIVSHQQHFRCRNELKCEPDKYGRFQCKRCRADKCIALGMKTDNIQWDRDPCFNTGNIEIPMTVDRLLGRNITQTHEFITFFDLSPIISDADYILQKIPKMEIEHQSNPLSPLEQLAFGLREVRKSQMLENIPEMRKIGKMDTWSHWVQSMRRACRWIMHFDEFQKIVHDDKMTIIKCMWHFFNRFERIAMTAEMRRRNLCHEKEYVFSTELRINYDKLEMDTEWFTNETEDNVKYYTGPFESWFCDSTIMDLIELQPTDVELSFMLSNLCFHLAGMKLGGRIQEITERLQDIIADDLHKYYSKNDYNCRYSYRLTKLLGLIRQYLTYVEKKRNSIFLAQTFNVFRITMSHPEMFEYSV